jgi:hypothetical protein
MESILMDAAAAGFASIRWISRINGRMSASVRLRTAAEVGFRTGAVVGSGEGSAAFAQGSGFYQTTILICGPMSGLMSGCSGCEHFRPENWP